MRRRNEEDQRRIQASTETTYQAHDGREINKLRYRWHHPSFSKIKPLAEVSIRNSSTKNSVIWSSSPCYCCCCCCCCCDYNINHKMKSQLKEDHHRYQIQDEVHFLPTTETQIIDLYTRHRSHLYNDKNSAKLSLLDNGSNKMKQRNKRKFNDNHHICSIASLPENRNNNLSPKRRCHQSSSMFWNILTMVVFFLLTINVDARHYIAPGPCTWTHMMSNPSLSSSSSRDIRLKSSSTLSSFSSPSSSSNELSHFHSSSHSHSSETSLANDFDVSLRCSVPILTPYTLNLSLIDAQHTIRLSIQCYENENGNNQYFNIHDDPSNPARQSIYPPSYFQQLQQRSTLRLVTTTGHQMLSHQPQPFEHLRSLQSLQIENCLLDRLPSDTFRGLSSLRNLTIRRASIISTSAFDDPDSEQPLPSIDVDPLIVEPYSFRHVESILEHLDLSQNNIESLPNDLFCPFLTLHTLNLSYNHLVNLASFGLIDPATGRLCLQELHHLDLSNNRLEFVPETSGVAALKNLQHLNLSSNHITEITELAFSALRRLHILDISGNRLRTLPGRMFRDSDELRELHLAQNGLIELPVGLFQGLSKLQVLDVAGNQITSDTFTPETFADLIRVIVLNLSGNRLRRLPASTFQNQYSLQVLSLESNELETIDEGAFATLYNLHTLKLAGNRFRHLPESVLSGLFVLQELSLAQNQLEHVHEDAFKNCSNLQILNLSSNRLTTIPMALRSLNKLYQLDLSANKFTTWIDSTPLTNSALGKLHLNDNYLVNVSRNALRTIASTLHHLDLGGNRLRSLEKDTFVDLRQSLRVLRLDRNEFADILTASFADVKQLDRLQVLNISFNHIVRFDYALIPNGLLILDLSYNRLESLGNYYEREAHLRLEEIDVSGNQLKEILATSIPNSIRVLNLRQNRLEKIDQFAFVAKHNVTYVDLRNNSLRRIDNNAFRLGVQRPTTRYFLSGSASSLLSSSQAYLAQAISTSGEFPGGVSRESSIRNLPPPIFLISGNPYYCDCTMEWLQRVNQLVGGVTGSGTISTYPRIGDLDQVECELPFTRQATSTNAKQSEVILTTSATPGAISQQQSTSNNGAATNRIPLLQANSSNFLCRYRSHCFALCHCCEFDACDCEMMCPENCTCYYDQTWNTNIVDCSGGRYQQVPLRIPMDVTSLYLDGNHLHSLNAHTFIGRKNLRILHLNHSIVETISNRSFNGLVYLEELHLEHNLLTALYGYEFESLHYLTTLNLQHNRLTFINDKTFHPLRSLQVLQLDHNHLQTFGQWLAIDPTASPTLSTSAYHHHHHHQNKLTLSLGENPWSCQCSSLAIMYETLWQFRQRVIVQDQEELRCQPNGSMLFVGANYLIDQCNLTRQYYSMLNNNNSPINNIQTNGQSSQQPPSSQQKQESYYTSRPPPHATSHSTQASQLPHELYPQNANNFDSIYHQVRPIINQQNNNSRTQQPIITNNPDDENDPDLTYQPIDLLGGLRPKLLPPTQNHTGQQYWPGSHFSPSSPSSSTSPMSFNSSSWFWIVLIPLILLVLCTAIFLAIRHKQDIQLWFYGRYGIRLFESGFCFGSGDGSNGSSGSGSVSSSRSRRRNGRNGFNDTYVRDSEKLFDAFVIYARQDESFVAQQLAAELECGYPPYRLCLRYRDLPAPTNVDTLNSNGAESMGTMSTKDHGYAFDAVTQAIECSRRTLVVISEQFLQSEWCKFELKAAHQETLTSCKTHRLIVVVVPPGGSNQQTVPIVTTSPMNSPTAVSTPSQVNNNNNPPAKQAESLLQRLDSETKTCIRGVTILTWQERRFWEKLRFAMPASSTIGAGGGSGSSSGVIGSVGGALGSLAFSSTGTASRHQSQHHTGHVPVVCDNNLKGRTSTVVVTNCGPGGYPTLAPSSLSSSSSLARSTVLYDSTTTTINQQQQIYQHHYHYAQLPPSGVINQSTMSLHKLGQTKQNQNQHSPVVRNPFSTKPLPPPPNQPLPPLPLVTSNSSYNPSVQSPIHYQQSSTEQVTAPPPYVEYINQQHPQSTLMESSSDQTAESCMSAIAPVSGSLHGPQTMVNIHGRNHPHNQRHQQSYYMTQRSPRAPL